MKPKHKKGIRSIEVEDMDTTEIILSLAIILVVVIFAVVYFVGVSK